MELDTLFYDIWGAKVYIRVVGLVRLEPREEKEHRQEDDFSSCLRRFGAKQGQDLRL